jgi:50S ribosomal protein L16 3-hydroxylase
LSVAFLDHVRDAIELSGQYADGGLNVTRHPAKIDRTMQRRFAQLLRDVQMALRDPVTVRRFTGCYLTEPKSHVVFDAPMPPMRKGEFRKLAMKRGVELELKARMLYDRDQIFLNGSATIPDGSLGIALHELADKRRLDGSAVRRLESSAGIAFLYELYCEGVLAIGRR